MKRGARYLAEAAVIAAAYGALTVSLAPISSGLIQCRVSEALCILPYFTGAAVPGLFLGCLLGNLLSGAAVYDVVFGSLATLLAAFFTRMIRTRNLSRYLTPLPAVAANAGIVGAVLVYGYGIGVPYWTACLYVALGQAVSCYGLGIPLLLLLTRLSGRLFR